MKPNYRRCLSCRRVAHKESFLRVVRDSSSRQVQLEGMGRSVYLCPQMSCFKAAQHKDRLGRSLKASVPSSIYRVLRERLITSNTEMT